jgi:hypothetical protein
MGLVPGTRLGQYEITGPLGAGGMGDVYRATDAKLGRDVAVKVLPAELAGGRHVVLAPEARSPGARIEKSPGLAAENVGWSATSTAMSLPSPAWNTISLPPRSHWPNSPPAVEICHLRPFFANDRTYTSTRPDSSEL